jgi:hypothetical protein
MKRAIILAALLLTGCEKSKEQVDTATSQCLAIGGVPEYVSNGIFRDTITRIDCVVKTPDGSKTYRVRPDGGARQ